MFPYRLGQDIKKGHYPTLDAARSKTLRIYREKLNEMKL
jgi:hypothetical protein